MQALSKLAGWLRFRPQLFFALIAVWLAAVLMWQYGRLFAFYIPTTHVDGAFQTASGMYRLYDGQVLGRDFQTYIGPGVLLSLFPLFALGGATLSASLQAAHCLALVGGAFPVAAIAALKFRRHRHGTRIAAFVFIAFACVASVRFADLPPFIQERVLPGNSLRPLRALVAYWGCFAAVHVLSSRLSQRARTCAVGAIMGGCLLWSNDFGPASAAAIGLLLVVDAVWRRQRIAIAVAWAGGSCIGIGILLFTLVTGGHPLALVRYSLDVAGDQYWYFASWDFKAHPTLWRLLKLVTGTTYGGWLLVPLLAWRSWLRRDLPQIASAVIGLATLLGGITATWGGHFEAGYFANFNYWVAIQLTSNIVAWIAVVLEQRLPKVASTASRWATSPVGRTLPLIALLGALGWSWMIVRERVHQTEITARTNPELFYVPELGGYLNNAFRDHVAFARTHRGILEEYWGLASAITRERSKVRVDSVIHALGSERSGFAARILEHPYVITTARGLTLDWQTWNTSANWWFYRPLRENYSARPLSPTTLLWTKDPNTRSAIWTATPCEVTSHEGSAALRIHGGPGYYEVTLNGTVKPPRRGIVKIQNFVNGVDGGYLALDPSANIHRFPVRIPPYGTGTLRFEVMDPSDRKATYTASEGFTCTARTTSHWQPEAFPPHGTPLQVTDLHWNTGYGRTSAAIVLQYSRDAQRHYRPGRTVLFTNGIRRKITDNQRVGAYLNVYLEGPPIGPDAGAGNVIDESSADREAQAANPRP